LQCNNADAWKRVAEKTGADQDISVFGQDHILYLKRAVRSYLRSFDLCTFPYIYFRAWSY
jgi:hypothetical protein